MEGVEHQVAGLGHHTPRAEPEPTDRLREASGQRRLRGCGCEEWRSAVVIECGGRQQAVDCWQIPSHFGVKIPQCLATAPSIGKHTAGKEGAATLAPAANAINKNETSNGVATDWACAHAKQRC